MVQLLFSVLKATEWTVMMMRRLLVATMGG